MTMTDRDRKKYDGISEFIQKWQNEKILKIGLPTSNEVRTAEEINRDIETGFARTLTSLVERVENLEKLMFLSLLNDAGEQGITPELKEAMKETGFWDLYTEAMRIMAKK